MNFEERSIDVNGLPTRYLTAGAGPSLVLLHGVGDSALNWQWVLPALASTHQVYAPDLPGSGASAKPNADYSPAFFTRFLVDFLDALGIESTAVIGNSLGGLVGLRLSLSEPERVTSLGLVASAGLGREVTYALRSLALPGYGRLATTWAKRPPGAVQRILGRSALLFARPRRVPREWLKEQYRLARRPGFLSAQLAAVRAQVGLRGQYEILTDQLSRLQMPVLILWGTRDRVFPYSQAQEAFKHLQAGSLELIPDCGHLPHVERPDNFLASLEPFLREQT